MKSTSKDRIVDLGQELDAIHAENILFWKRGANNSRESRVQHQRRLNRMEGIMKELAAVAEAHRKKRALPQNKSAHAKTSKTTRSGGWNVPSPLRIRRESEIKRF